ncbi:MAG TPA: hypothetical protein VEY93_14715 [Longimicrobium sp.]|jgi:hypothetical protein|nr:hypothetical protein [Longimicrobium sp.]
MSFRLTFTPEAAAVLKRLEESADPKLKKVRKALGLLETNPRHPGLETHQFESLRGPGGEKVFEAYVENRTPRAWRIFWYYGPQPGMIRILNITPHP